MIKDAVIIEENNRLAGAPERALDNNCRVAGCNEDFSDLFPPDAADCAVPSGPVARESAFLTPMNKTNFLCRLASVFLLIMLAVPLFAQEKGDSVFTYRFIAGKDMFYSPGMNNGKELARLFDCVDRYRELIADGKVFLYVDGYGISKNGRKEIPATVKTRSNRVKSELITRKGLKEENFVTHNHLGQGNFVTVRIIIPKDIVLSGSHSADGVPQPAQKPDSGVAVKAEDNKETLENIADAGDVNVQDDGGEKITENLDDQKSEAVPVQPEVVETVNEADTASPAPLHSEKSDSPFALKTNLLGYLVLMPNLEAEWKFSPRWSAALEVQSAWWAKSSPRRVYRLATLIPEVRYWVIDRSRWHGMYVGAFIGGGLYDLSNSKKGHEGEGGMVGVSAGYMWPVSKHLSFDAGIGIGYMYARDKLYTPLDGHYLYQLTKNINYFGPLRLKLSLVWRIPK